MNSHTTIVSINEPDHQRKTLNSTIFLNHSFNGTFRKMVRKQNILTNRQMENTKTNGGFKNIVFEFVGIENEESKKWRRYSYNFNLVRRQ